MSLYRNRVFAMVLLFLTLSGAERIQAQRRGSSLHELEAAEAQQTSGCYWACGEFVTDDPLHTPLGNWCKDEGGVSGIGVQQGMFCIATVDSCTIIPCIIWGFNDTGDYYDTLRRCSGGAARIKAVSTRVLPASPLLAGFGFGFQSSRFGELGFGYVANRPTRVGEFFSFFSLASEVM